MSTQQKTMMFTVIAGLVYGLWFFLAPGSYMSMMMFPEDLVTPALTSQLQQTGMALLVISYWINATSGYVTKENTSSYMTHHAVGWGIFGIGGLYILASGSAMTTDNPFLYQNIVFLGIAGVFLAMRNPKTD